MTPFLGGLVEMVMDPYSFWERQKDAANVTNPGYSYNSLAGKMILTITDAGTRRRGATPRASVRSAARGPREPWSPACRDRGSSPPRRQVPRADGRERS